MTSYDYSKYSSKMSNGKSKKRKHSPKQIQSHPTVYHSYPSSKKTQSGGCGCGSKLPKR
jgi:hypothetical protein